MRNILYTATIEFNEQQLGMLRDAFAEHDIDRVIYQCTIHLENALTYDSKLRAITSAAMQIGDAVILPDGTSYPIATLRNKECDECICFTLIEEAQLMGLTLERARIKDITVRVVSYNPSAMVVTKRYIPRWERTNGRPTVIPEKKERPSWRDYIKPSRNVPGTNNGKV